MLPYRAIDKTSVERAGNLGEMPGDIGAVGKGQTRRGVCTWRQNWRNAAECAYSGGVSEAVKEQQKPRVVAVASGKGGTGKSLVAANIGIFLATLGKRIVLLDGATGCANLHVLTGLHRPASTLSEACGDAALTDLIELAPVPGLHLISGANDPVWAADLRPSQSWQLRQALAQLDAEYVVVDLNPGMSAQTLDWFLAADIGVLVTLPEPTSVQLSYRFMRAAFLRCLRSDNVGRAVRQTVWQMAPVEGGIPSPRDIYHRLRGMPVWVLDEDDDELAASAGGDGDGLNGDGDGHHGANGVDNNANIAAAVAERIAAFRPYLIMNCVRSKADMELGRAVAAAARWRLGLPVGYLGHLEYDEAVWAAVRRGRPLLVEHPEARVSKCLEKVTRRLLAIRPNSGEPVALDGAHNYYELLEVEPTASFEDIRRANRRIRELYGRDSIVVGGLYTEAELDELHATLDEAYGTLMDAAKRRAYDRALFPEGIPTEVLPLPRSAPVRVEVPPSERPPMPTIDDSTVFSGGLLKQVREAQGIDLRDIAEHTKIGMSYLESIEDENFAKLPAAVYVRGFLVEYVKVLGLDSERVVEHYLARYRGAPKPAES